MDQWVDAQCTIPQTLGIVSHTQSHAPQQTEISSKPGFWMIVSSFFSLLLCFFLRVARLHGSTVQFTRDQVKLEGLYTYVFLVSPLTAPLSFLFFSLEAAGRQTGGQAGRYARARNGQAGKAGVSVFLFPLPFFPGTVYSRLATTRCQISRVEYDKVQVRGTRRFRICGIIFTTTTTTVCLQGACGLFCLSLSPPVRQSVRQSDVGPTSISLSFSLVDQPGRSVIAAAGLWHGMAWYDTIRPSPRPRPRPALSSIYNPTL